MSARLGRWTPQPASCSVRQTSARRSSTSPSSHPSTRSSACQWRYAMTCRWLPPGNWPWRWQGGRKLHLLLRRCPAWEPARRELVAASGGGLRSWRAGAAAVAGPRCEAYSSRTAITLSLMGDLKRAGLQSLTDPAPDLSTAMWPESGAVRSGHPAGSGGAGRPAVIETLNEADATWVWSGVSHQPAESSARGAGRRGDRVVRAGVRRGGGVRATRVPGCSHQGHGVYPRATRLTTLAWLARRSWDRVPERRGQMPP